MSAEDTHRKLWFILLVLFIPCILNISISTIIAFMTIRGVMAEGRSPSEAGVEIMRNIFKYNFYWSVIQVSLGFYLARAMGGWSWLKNQFSIRDLSQKPARSILLILALFSISYALIMGEQVLSASFYGGWEQYMREWREITQAIPYWSKLYMVAIAPFTAGIFEEIIWRGYGISRLEQHIGTSKAVIVQAVAFGFWHGISLHTLITAIIGLVFGIVYAKRRKLLNISIAHIVTDIVGFYFAFMV